MVAEGMGKNKMPAYLRLVCLLIFCAGMLPGAFLSAAPARGNNYQFSDKPLKEGIELPNWFKLSFLELYDDLDDVK